MKIRHAADKDIPRIMELLSQVLEVHAKLRPDIFISGRTKYTDEEFKEILRDPARPVYTAVDEDDSVLGYVFCVVKEPPFSTNMIQFKTLYIDDLCVDEKCRGRHVGQELFEYAKERAKEMGCYDVTLNVWEGNDSAAAFYRKMGLFPKETQLEYILK